jgi:hypothetical protein
MTAKAGDLNPNRIFEGMNFVPRTVLEMPSGFGDRSADLED